MFLALSWAVIILCISFSLGPLLSFSFSFGVLFSKVSELLGTEGSPFLDLGLLPLKFQHRVKGEPGGEGWKLGVVLWVELMKGISGVGHELIMGDCAFGVGKMVIAISSGLLLVVVVMVEAID